MKRYANSFISTSRNAKSRSMKAWVATTLALAGFFATASAAAEERNEENLSTVAVQPRQVHHWHELNLSLGFLPTNAFVKGLTVGGNYTLHFNQLFGWEILRAYGVVTEFETGVIEELAAREITNTPEPHVEWVATSSFLFSPFYGKIAVVNRTLIFSEVFLVAGLGFGKRTQTNTVLVDAGVAVRIFFGEYISLRLDVRWEGYFAGVTDLHNELWLALGLSVHLG